MPLFVEKVYVALAVELDIKLQLWLCDIEPDFNHDFWAI